MDTQDSRRSRLLEELQKAENVATHNTYVYSLADDADDENTDLSNWDATIIGPEFTSHSLRKYHVKIYCGPDYPDNSPSVQFISQINLPCVNHRTGKVDLEKLPGIGQWKSEYTIESILLQIWRYMSAFEVRKLPQPPEGSVF